MSGNWEFNQLTCNFNISIYRVNDKKNTYTTIPNNTINDVIVTSDLDMMFPIIEITMDDPYCSIIPMFPDDGETILAIYYKDEIGSFLTEFVVNTINLVDYKIQQSSFIIKGHHIISNILNSKLLYSTGKLPKVSTECINEILKTNLKDFYNDFKGTHSAIKLNYISIEDQTIKDTINYLLLNSHNSSTGIYFLSYNLFKNKLSLENINDNFKNRKISDLNVSKIATYFGTGLKERAFTITRTNFINKKDNDILALDNIALENFDQTKRYWSKDIISHNKAMSTLPKTIENSKYSMTKAALKELKDLGGKYTFSQIPKTKWKHNARILNQFKFKDVLQLQTYGLASRNAGEVYAISVDNPDQPLYKQFYGLWFISRASMVFKVKAKDFSQDISLIRGDGIIRNGEPFTMKSNSKNIREIK